MITQSKLKELLHYCPETGIFTNIKSRGCARAGCVSGSVSGSTGYVSILVNGTRYASHRLAWLYVYGNLPPDQLDHINRSRTDNRICNLRLATNAENAQNQSIYRSNKSGHAGVNWNKQYKKWNAQIMVNGKQIHLGRFNDLAEAISARKAAEQKYHTFCHGVA